MSRKLRTDQLPVAMVATQKCMALVDLEAGQFRVLEDERGSYYGITWSDDTLWLVARGYEPGRLIGFNDRMVELEPLDVQLGEPDPNGNGPHQIIFNPADNLLYITDTERDRVIVINPISDTAPLQILEWPTWGLPGLHINSIWFNHQGMWITEHRRQKLPKLIRCVEGNQDKAVYHLALEELADGPQQSGIHNIFVEKGVIYTLGPSAMITVDMLTLQTGVWRFPDFVRPGKHYLRGLARERDRWGLPGLARWYIGRSNATQRSERGFGSSAVLVLDSLLNVIKMVTLPERWGQINEIRLLIKEPSHNNLPCPIQWPPW